MEEYNQESRMIKIKLDKNHSCIMNYDEWLNINDWNRWREYLLFKYPHLKSGYRIPDRVGEVDSFENWKSNGKPNPSLFSYGELIKDEPSKEFVDMIMKK